MSDRQTILEKHLSMVLADASRNGDKWCPAEWDDWKALFGMLLDELKEERYQEQV